MSTNEAIQKLYNSLSVSPRFSLSFEEMKDLVNGVVEIHVTDHTVISHQEHGGKCSCQACNYRRYFIEAKIAYKCQLNRKEINQFDPEYWAAIAELKKHGSFGKGLMSLQQMAQVYSMFHSEIKPLSPKLYKQLFDANQNFWTLFQVYKAIDAKNWQWINGRHLEKRYCFYAVCRLWVLPENRSNLLPNKEVGLETIKKIVDEAIEDGSINSFFTKHKLIKASWKE